MELNCGDAIDNMALNVRKSTLSFDRTMTSPPASKGYGELVGIDDEIEGVMVLDSCCAVSIRYIQQRCNVFGEVDSLMREGAELLVVSCGQACNAIFTSRHAVATDVTVASSILT